MAVLSAHAAIFQNLSKIFAKSDRKVCKTKNIVYICHMKFAQRIFSKTLIAK